MDGSSVTGGGNETGDGTPQPLKSFLTSTDCGHFNSYAIPENKEFSIQDSLWRLQDTNADVIGDGRTVVLKPNLKWPGGNDHSEIESDAEDWSEKLAFDLMTQLDPKHEEDDYQISLEMRFLNDASMPHLALKFAINSRRDGVFTWSSTEHPPEDEENVVTRDGGIGCWEEPLSGIGFESRKLEHLQIKKDGQTVSLVLATENGMTNTIDRVLLEERAKVMVVVTASRNTSASDPPEEVRIFELGSACSQ